jgi:hypothetical protein
MHLPKYTITGDEISNDEREGGDEEVMNQDEISSRFWDMLKSGLESR